MLSPTTPSGTPPAAAPLRLGSLCTGYGGLDLAVEHVFDASMTWFAETDPHAAAVVDAHWPGVPNLGDLTRVNWTTVPAVDVLAAGFPCQPVSNAGKRKGIADERWIWPHVAEAVRTLRPSVIVLENVAAIVNRGMDGILGSLAALGFNAIWGCYRASWAGAPHRRDRWFLYGWDATADSSSERGRGPAVQAHTEPARGQARPEPAGGSVLVEAPADPAGLGHGNGRAPARRGLPPMPVGGAAPPSCSADGVSVDWGAYGPAVARWEHVTGLAAPPPTVRTEQGLRSSTQFVEWMQGLPRGWVTGRGLPRTAELRMLGNGVVPQQAIVALGDLINARTQRGLRLQHARDVRARQRTELRQERGERTALRQRVVVFSALRNDNAVPAMELDEALRCCEVAVHYLQVDHRRENAKQLRYVVLGGSVRSLDRVGDEVNVEGVQCGNEFRDHRASLPRPSSIDDKVALVLVSVLSWHSPSVQPAYNETAAASRLVVLADARLPVRAPFRVPEGCSLSCSALTSSRSISLHCSPNVGCAPILDRRRI